MRQNSGITLVELMLGVVLAGLLSVALVTVFLIGARAVDRIETQKLLQETLASTLFGLTRDIQMAETLEIDETGTTLRIQVFPQDSLEQVSPVEYLVKELRLIKRVDSTETVVIPPDTTSQNVSISAFDTTKIFSWCEDSLVKDLPLIDISFILEIDNEEQLYRLPYRTTIGIRNSEVKR